MEFGVLRIRMRRMGSCITGPRCRRGRAESKVQGPRSKVLESGNIEQRFISRKKSQNPQRNAVFKVPEESLTACGSRKRIATGVDACLTASVAERFRSGIPPGCYFL